jgi:hypothetical protein
MGALKLHLLEKNSKENQSKKSEIHTKKKIRISACDCPCWAFREKGKITMDDVQVTGSWNID